jgi:hypothetical protein
MKIITGLMAIFLGFYILYTSKYDVYYGYTISLGFVKYPVSLFFIWVGFRFIFTKEKKEKHSICPNCKQTYNHRDLEDAKYPVCKDVDLIDIEEYYKKHPFKKDEKESTMKP